jgi:hypothetical protein
MVNKERRSGAADRILRVFEAVFRQMRKVATTASMNRIPSLHYKLLRPVAGGPINSISTSRD